MSGDVSPYTALVTSEFQGATRFMAAVSASVQPVADNIAVADQLKTLFDLDNATGVQLDLIGLWVGRSRFLSVPLAGVYFSFGVSGLGFGQGVWKGPYDPTSGLVRMPDEPYRTLLRFQVKANRWDGSIDGAYDAYSVLFASAGSINWTGSEPVSWYGSGPVTWTGGSFNLLIQDAGDMTFFLALQGDLPDPITQAMLTSGQLVLKPAGQRVTGYMFETVAGAPFFGFGADNSSVGGFGEGAWGQLQPAT